MISSQPFYCSRKLDADVYYPQKYCVEHFLLTGTAPPLKELCHILWHCCGVNFSAFRFVHDSDWEVSGYLRAPCPKQYLHNEDRQNKGPLLFPSRCLE